MALRAASRRRLRLEAAQLIAFPALHYYALWGRAYAETWLPFGVDALLCGLYMIVTCRFIFFIRSRVLLLLFFRRCMSRSGHPLVVWTRTLAFIGLLALPIFLSGFIRNPETPETEEIKRLLREGRITFQEYEARGGALR